MTSLMTRKAFCGTLAGGTVALLFQACGGGGSDAAMAPAPGPAPAGCSDTIAANHPLPHSFTVATADLNSTTAKSYNIMGAADHNHVVNLSVVQLQDLKAGTTVSLTTIMGPGHEHLVTIHCT